MGNREVDRITQDMTGDTKEEERTMVWEEDLEGMKDHLIT